MIAKISIFFVFLFSSLLAQTDGITKPLTFSGEQVSFDSEGNVWVLSKTKNQLTRWLQSTRFDSVQTIGGIGLQAEALQMPEKIQVYSRNMVFVLDQDRSRILLLNNNLKPIRSLKVEDFNHPEIRRFQSFTYTLQGLFVLAQNTNKIFKINEFSKVEMEFGGWDTGNMVENPVFLLSNDKNQLFVVDTLKQAISVFSTYGVFEHNIHLDLGYKWSQAKISEHLIFLFHPDTNILSIYNTLTQTRQQVELELPALDIDFNIFQREFVILQKEKWFIKKW